MWLIVVMTVHADWSSFPCFWWLSVSFLTLSVLWEHEETGFINLELSNKTAQLLSFSTKVGRLLHWDLCCLSVPPWSWPCWKGHILCGVTTAQQGMQQADGTPLVSNLTCSIPSWSHFLCLEPHCSALGTQPSMCYFRRYIFQLHGYQSGETMKIFFIYKGVW